jgi:signal transduction histidine kinase
MVDKSTKRHALAALLLGALLGGLVFLFVRTVTIDFRGDAQALSLLRQLKDFDTRRDVDALRMTTDFETSTNPSDWSAMRARALHDLQKDPARAAVSDQLYAIQSAMTEKESAYYALKTAHTVTVDARKAAHDALVILGGAAGGARTRNSAHAATLAANIERIRTSLRDANIDRVAEIASELEARAAMLPAAAAGADPLLLEAAKRAESAVDAFITARAAEAAAWRKFAYTTAGGRIELAAQTASLSIDRALDERERWLVYLLAYALAFAIGAGYMGMRALDTLRRLRAVNDGLESRASQRSHHLADALRKLQESEAQLVQSQKMSSLGQLLAGVADEIGRPLALLRENLSTARSAMPDLRAAHDQADRLVEQLCSESFDAQQVDAAADALSERLRHLHGTNALDTLESLSWDGLKDVEQVVELAARLRSYSRLDRSKVASFNVNDGVQDTLLMARSLLRKVDVERALGDVPAITCSPSQVNQVLLNLVTNAAQSIDKPRGRITVTTRPSAPGSIAIDVADNGKGIASDALLNIFNPLFTAREDGEGMGLGLSIAHKIVSQHGGRIDVRSQVGVGSTFTVTLPLEPPPDLVATETNRSVFA